MRKRLIITTSTYSSRGGGIGVFATHSIKGLVDYHLRLVILHPNYQFPYDFIHRDINYIPLTTIPILKEISFFAKMFKLLKRGYSDIYNIHWFPGALICYIFKKLGFKIKYYVSTFGNEIMPAHPKNLFKHFVKRFMHSLMVKSLNGSDKVISISNYTKGVLVSFGVDESNIEVLPGGVDSDFFKPIFHTKELKKKYGFENKHIILSVGRLTKKKGFENLIAAFDNLSHKYADLLLIIIGKGDFKNELYKLVEKRNLWNKVKFIEYVSKKNLRDFYNMADFFILLSIENKLKGEYEGLGLVFLESASCGKAVIAANTGGISDAVVHKKTGFLVDPFDIKKVEEAMERILENPEESKRMGKYARQMILQKFDWKTITKRMYNIIFGT